MVLGLPSQSSFTDLDACSVQDPERAVQFHHSRGQCREAIAMSNDLRTQGQRLTLSRLRR